MVGDTHLRKYKNKTRAFGVFLASLASCFIISVTVASAEPQHSPEQYQAEIRTTTFGIPHIKADTEEAAAFGLGYVYARDNYCLLTDIILTVRGERSKFFGPQETGGAMHDSGILSLTNLHSDFYFKLINSQENLDVALGALSLNSKALMTAYVAGANKAVTEAKQNGGLSENCPFAAKAGPFSVYDAVAHMRSIVAEASNRFGKYMIAADKTLNGSEDNITEDARLMLSEERRAFGSNAIAFGRDATANKKGLLLANPHLPWYGSMRLYQAHITVPGVMDVMGATLPGTPTLLFGFSDEFAWTHTVNTSSHYTVQKLSMAGDAWPSYVVDGEKVPLKKITVQVELPENSAGDVRYATHDFWTSEFGPVIRIPGMLDWDQDTAYALADANLQNTRMIDTWSAINKAHSLKEMDSAVKSLVGMPWVNIIAADKDGNAYYANMSVIPNVSNEQLDGCVSENDRRRFGQGKFIMFVLDSSQSKCHWQENADAPQAGILPGNALPSLIRHDFVQNSNDSAWLTNPEAPLEQTPLIVSASDYPQNGRTRLGIIGAQKAIQETGAAVDAKAVKALLLENGSLAAEWLKSSATKVCAGELSISIKGQTISLQKACNALVQWDGHANLDSRGYLLAQAWLRNIKKQPNIWKIAFDPDAPLITPRGFQDENAESIAVLRSALAQAVTDLEAHNIAYEAPLWEVQRVNAGSLPIPMHGGDADDVYNVTHGIYSNGYNIVRNGASYLALITYTDAGPVADTVLVYGQSTKPRSVHSIDQTHLYANKMFIRLPFREAEIESELIRPEETIQADK